MKYLVIVFQIILSFLIGAIFRFVDIFLFARTLTTDKIYNELTYEDGNPVSKIIYLLVNWLVWFLIFYKTHQLIKKRFDKKYIDYIPVVTVVLLITAIWTITVYEWFERDCDISKVTHITEEVSKSLKSTPKNKLYYYSNGNKVRLWRRIDKCGNPTFSTGGSTNHKIIIGNEISISFFNSLPEKNINEILSKEKLDIIKETIPGSYTVKPTSNSKFLNTIEMSIYLVEKYPQIKYAKPAMIHSVAIPSNLDSLKSRWYEAIYLLTTGNTPRSGYTIPL